MRAFRLHSLSCLIGVVLTFLAFLAQRSGAQPIFSDDFASFANGNFNGGQFQSGLVVAYGGNLTDWDKAGGGVVHAVDRANVFGSGNNPSDFAVMIWQDTVMTQVVAVAASNAVGTP